MKAPTNLTTTSKSVYRADQSDERRIACASVRGKMDAASVDADVKLYKASAELLAELQQKLPLLLQAPNKIPRKWVLFTKTSEISQLVS